MTVAHAGHWYHALLYLAPVIVISVALWRSGAREDRELDRMEREATERGERQADDFEDLD